MFLHVFWSEMIRSSTTYFVWRSMTFYGVLGVLRSRHQDQENHWEKYGTHCHNLRLFSGCQIWTLTSNTLKMVPKQCKSPAKHDETMAGECFMFEGWDYLYLPTLSCSARWTNVSLEQLKHLESTPWLSPGSAIQAHGAAPCQRLKDLTP